MPFLPCKMTTRDNSEFRLRSHGFLEATPFCDGPHVSSVKGIDKPCCAKCHNFRIIYYRGIGRIVSDQKTIHFIENLKHLQIEDLDTAYAVSKCGHIKTLCFIYGRIEMYADTFYSILLKQFFCLRKMHITLNEIDRKIFGFTKTGIPIIFPYKYTEVPKYGDDEGVSLVTVKNDLYIKEVDTVKRERSGKWTFLFQFYKSLEFLSKEFGTSQQKYEMRIGEHLYLKVPLECKNENI